MRRDQDIRAQLHDPDFFLGPAPPPTPVVDFFTDVAALLGATFLTLWGIAGWVFVVWLLAGVFG